MSAPTNPKQDAERSILAAEIKAGRVPEWLKPAQTYIDPNDLKLSGAALYHTLSRDLRIVSWLVLAYRSCKPTGQAPAEMLDAIAAAATRIAKRAGKVCQINDHIDAVFDEATTLLRCVAITANALLSSQPPLFMTRDDVAATLDALGSLVCTRMERETVEEWERLWLETLAEEEQANAA